MSSMAAEPLSLTAELRLATSAARQAASISRTVLSQHLEAAKSQIDVDGRGVDIAHEEKQDHSPVTVADFAVQALLAASVQAAFPGDNLIGEETADMLRQDHSLREKVWELLNGLDSTQEAEERLWRIPRDADHMCDLIDYCGNGVPPSSAEEGEASQRKRTWVFDPIDGTQAFIHGQMYAVNMALLDGSARQLLSVVAVPMLNADTQAPALMSDDTVDASGKGALLWAIHGQGAWVQPLLDHGMTPPRRLEVLSDTLKPDDLRFVTFYKSNTNTSGLDHVHAAVAKRLGAMYPGCDLLAWVARWVSLAMGLSNMTVWIYKKQSRIGKIWDHAGAMLLFEEVGGLITDVNGKPIDLGAGKMMTQNFGFVAAPRSLHPQVLKVVQEELRADGKGELLLDG
jgi:3'(2'), 5'-bisphosphate nucleotidase